MTQLSKTMTNTLIEVLLHEKLKKYPLILDILQIDGVVLGGGAIRDIITGEEPKDFDFFLTNLSATVDVLQKLSSIYIVVNSNAYTTTLTTTVATGDPFLPESQTIAIQLVHKKAYESELSIIEDFDFTVTQFAMSKNGVVLSERAMQDLENKEIRINVITKPLNSLNRLVKYQEKGYNTKNAYNYILDVMKDKGEGVCLGASYYEG